MSRLPCCRKRKQIQRIRPLIRCGRHLRGRASAPFGSHDRYLATPRSQEANAAISNRPAVVGLVSRAIRIARPIISAIGMAGIAIRVGRFAAVKEQKLFPHFSEARTAVFAVEKIE